MQKILLITGGLGYIGSHAVVAFEKAGYKTVIIDNLSNSHLDTLKRIGSILGYQPDFHKIDIANKHSLEELFERHVFDGVIHFAGLKSVSESMKDPFGYYHNNVIGSLVLFELMEKNAVRNIIFSSSATVYDGELNKMPLHENSILGTSNPYGTTKLVLELILKDLAKTSFFNCIALRYFNPVGAHETGMIGEKPNGIPNNLLPYIMDVASGKREKLYVFGNDYPTKDGSGVRDYIHVQDLVEGHLKAYEKLESEELGFRAINLGTGKGTSVFEMIKMTEEITKKKIPYEVTGRRDGDLATVYANADLAEDFLGWKAKRSVEEGIKDSWNFNKSNN